VARNTRNVSPGMSGDARDKLLAALNWHYGKQRQSPEYQRAPIYFDAWFEGCPTPTRTPCSRWPTWWAARDAAEGMAASLPPAPRCPL
jgi:hypothetical protein